MTRKEFISKLGVGAAFALTATCLGGCTKDVAPEARDIDLTIDLTDPVNEELLINGGYIIVDGIVVARSLSGEYIAATVTCSHNLNDNIIYQDGEWFCTLHGARFTEEGDGLNAFGSDGLLIYVVETVDANTIRVFSE